LPPPLQHREGRRSQDSVPRHIGQIEPWIGGSLAAYTAWLYAVEFRERHMLWVYVAVAAVLALWSWRRPARMHSDMMIRAVGFSLLGLFILTEGGLDATTAGPQFFFWISVPMVFYGFLLRATLAWWLLGVNFIASAAALLFSAGDVELAPVVARAGFLLVFAVASIRMGTVLRRTDELLEARRMDAASGMLNEYGFVDYGAEVWNDCRRAGLPATLVFLDIPDMQRLRALYGAGISRLAIDKSLRLMQGLSTGKNILGRLGASRFVLLMPGATREEAMYFLGDKLGRPPQIELDEDDLELIFLVNIHAAESQLQTVSFSRFFEAEHDLLDFYFSDKRQGSAQADAQGLSAVPTTVPRGLATPRDGADGHVPDIEGPPTTLPVMPPR
jgi:GGDEF domain-containing protein